MVVQQDPFHKIPVEPWEVGAELLDILSRGIYSDAKDAIREYVQNGVDAQANRVTFTVRGPRATIRDDGLGMDWDTLRRSRRFGISDKSPHIHVGFRGIGLYAAFGMCDSMRITTRQAGSEELLHLEVRFGAMRHILEQERISQDKSGVGLTELLEDFTLFRRDPYPPNLLGDHFTLVTLEGLTREYRSQLNDSDALATYLLNTLPIAFPDADYGRVVNGWLRDQLGLNPINLLCRVGDEPEFTIEPRLAEGVETPQHDWIENSEGEKIAFIWSALSTRGERIPSASGRDEGAGVGGYLMKIKGFTLGDRVLLKPLWPTTGGRALYHHYTGEVHILDAADVYPNAARNDLEPSLSKQNLQKAFVELFKDLNRRADLTRDILKTERRMEGIRETLFALDNRRAEADRDPLELYRESMNFAETLERTERDLLRLRRGRRAVQPTPAQRQQLDALRTELRDALAKTRDIVRNTGKRTAEKTPRRSKPSPGVPPRVALITRASASIQEMMEQEVTPALEGAAKRLLEARRSRSVARAVEILDELKANGVTLSGSVEASRKELRVYLGWSPVAPVSLIEALAESEFLAATDREKDIIRAVDRGLLHGFGSRGEEYQTAIRAIAESVSSHDGLQ